MDALRELCNLASQYRLAFLCYQKPGEDSTTDRVVEPYRLQESGGNLMVQSWQVKPEIGDKSKWRNFRIDRITRVGDGGGTFKPRCAVTIHQGEVEAFKWGHDPVQTTDIAAGYYLRKIEKSMLDGHITPNELMACKSYGSALSPQARKGVHAQVYSNVLQEVLMDGEVSEKEERYLRGVREFLSQLGWAP